MSENTDTRTATQRIEDLEKVSTILWQQAAQFKGILENLLRAQGDMALVKEALKLLNKKSEAIIQAATSGGITADSVSALVTKMNVDDLTAQVQGYLASGHLAVTDAVAADSYVVCEEFDSAGTLTNPRIQFRLDSQDEQTQAALTGKKAGDTVSFGEGKLSAKLLEVYTLTEPAPADAATAATETAPAEAATATDAESTTTPDDTAPAEAPTAPAPTGPSNDALAPPTESPVTEFVPSQAGAMTTAS